MSSRRLPFLLFALSFVALFATCVPGGIAASLVWESREGSLDWSPADIAGGVNVHEDDYVWLRGTRDRDHPVTLADGRVLYPTNEARSVMVECGVDDCAGSLRGSVERLHVADPLPAGWPVKVGNDVWVVRVGALSGHARQTLRITGAVATALLIIAIGCAFAGGLFVARTRRAAREGP